MISHDGPFFTATVLKTAATRPLSDEFNFFQITHAQDKFNEQAPVTTVRGDKLLSHNGNAEVAGSVEIVGPTGGKEAAVLSLQKDHSPTDKAGSTVMVRA